MWTLTGLAARPKADRPSGDELARLRNQMVEAEVSKPRRFVGAAEAGPPNAEVCPPLSECMVRSLGVTQWVYPGLVDTVDERTGPLA
jgi:hypothetical protein